MFELRQRIRYSEIGSDGILTLPALLDYFQDCSVAQSEAVGLGVSCLRQMQRAWILNAWQVVCESLPGLGDEVLVQTWPYAFQGLFAFRNFVMRAADSGRVLAYANSTWILMDTGNGRPTRITEELIERYGADPEFPMEKSPRKLLLPEDMTEAAPITVARYFIDTNGHMNNEKYVMAAEGYLPPELRVKELRVEYRRAAKEGDVLYPLLAGDERTFYVSLADSGHVPYAVVQFLHG